MRITLFADWGGYTLMVGATALISSTVGSAGGVMSLSSGSGGGQMSLDGFVEPESLQICTLDVDLVM